MIIDDPVKPDEALSEARRTSVNEWFDNSLLSRLNSPETGVIIIVMQRLHTDDLVGHVTEKEGWTVLSLPAIAEADESIPYDAFLGRRLFTRRAGEALHPARLSVAGAEQLRRDVGSYNFAAQYQQSPVPAEGHMVRRSWFGAYKPEEVERRLPLVVQSWDTANKAGELNDYSVCTTWGVRGTEHFLLDVWRRRVEFPDLRRAVVEQAKRFRPNVILVEDKASGTQLIQELRSPVVKAVSPPPSTDKTMRLHMHTATFERGSIRLPVSASWLDAYVAELTSFPAGKHDDQVDSTTQFLGWLPTYRAPMVVTPETLARLKERVRAAGNRYAMPGYGR